MRRRYWAEEHFAREQRKAIDRMLKEEVQTAKCLGKLPGKPPLDFLERVNGPISVEEGGQMIVDLTGE